MSDHERRILVTSEDERRLGILGAFDAATAQLRETVVHYGVATPYAVAVSSLRRDRGRELTP